MSQNRLHGAALQQVHNTVHLYKGFYYKTDKVKFRETIVFVIEDINNLFFIVIQLNHSWIST